MHVYFRNYMYCNGWCYTEEGCNGWCYTEEGAKSSSHLHIENIWGMAFRNDFSDGVKHLCSVPTLTLYYDTILHMTS